MSVYLIILLETRFGYFKISSNKKNSNSSNSKKFQIAGGLKLGVEECYRYKYELYLDVDSRV